MFSYSLAEDEGRVDKGPALGRGDVAGVLDKDGGTSSGGESPTAQRGDVSALGRGGGEGSRGDGRNSRGDENS